MRKEQKPTGSKSPAKLSVLEILEETAGKAAEKKKSNSPKQHVQEWWRYWMEDRYEKKLGKFTGKQSGQAKLLLDKIGMEHGSEEEIGAFVEYVFRNWQLIREKTMLHAGLKDAPGVPDVGFVLVHAYTIQSMIEEENKPIDTMVQLSAPKDPPEVKPKPEKPAPAPLATMEDIFGPGWDNPPE